MRLQFPTLGTLLILFTIFSVNSAQSSGVDIYFIQVVKFMSNPATSWKTIHINEPDYSTFLTRKDCENELLRAITEPSSSVARENGLSGEFLVRRQSSTRHLEVINDNGVRGYTKGMCVQKYLNPQNLTKIKKLQ